MKSSVRKWGNSLGLRIPKVLAEAIGVREGSAVFVSVVRGNLVVKPGRTRKLALSELLRRVTPKNRHGEVDTGDPVGREAW